MSAFDIFRPTAGSYRAAIASAAVAALILVIFGLAGWFWVGFPLAVLILVSARVRATYSGAKRRSDK